MTPDQRELVREAFPEDADGEPRCGHCGDKRKATLNLCFRCWRRLSVFVRAEILRASLVDKAHMIVNTRPVKDRHGRATPRSSCGLVVAFCECAKPKDHDGPHECFHDDCGGQWRYDADGEFVLVRIPGLGRETAIGS